MKSCPLCTDGSFYFRLSSLSFGQVWIYPYLCTDVNAKKVWLIRRNNSKE